MIRRLALPLLLVALALLPAAAGAQAPGCEGKLSGAIQGTFACSVRMTSDAAGKVSFTLETDAILAGVTSFQPGTFELPAAPAPRSYTLADLTQGGASLTAKDGTRYDARVEKAPRGEVSLTFTYVEREQHGFFMATGSYRARLVPAKGTKGEVVVEATF